MPGDLRPGYRQGDGDRGQGVDRGGGSQGRGARLPRSGGSGRTRHALPAARRLRGRVPAPAYARQHHAATAAEHAARYVELAGSGVGTVFVALPDLVDADDLRRLEPVLDRLG